jgi:hypothetical protein
MLNPFLFVMLIIATILPLLENIHASLSSFFYFSNINTLGDYLPAIRIDRRLFDTCFPKLPTLNDPTPD